MVTTQKLEEMFGKLIEDIIGRYEEKFTAQKQKIVDLEEKIVLKEKMIKNLSIKCDGLSNTVDDAVFECMV